jgi:hypothetical protein
LQLFHHSSKHGYLYFGLFKITNAPITPGTHAQSVSIKTIRTDPQPLSQTAKGGNIIDKTTLQKDIIIGFYKFVIIFIYLQKRLFPEKVTLFKEKTVTIINIDTVLIGYIDTLV